MKRRCFLAYVNSIALLWFETGEKYERHECIVVWVIFSHYYEDYSNYIEKVEVLLYSQLQEYEAKT